MHRLRRGGISIESEFVKCFWSREKEIKCAVQNLKKNPISVEILWKIFSVKIVYYQRSIFCVRLFAYLTSNELLNIRCSNVAIRKNHKSIFENFRQFLYAVNFHVRGWEMFETERVWFIPAAAPLQRSYGVVAVSQKCQNF